MTKETTRCARCVLPGSTPNITFDEDGVCSYCHSYIPREFKGEESLIQLLEEHRATGNSKYDCVASVSGGRDSTYILWKLVHDYRMRPLAVHYANPFSSPQATKNLESTVEQLGIDLIKWTYPNKDFHEEQTRKALKIWSRKPSHSMLPIICTVCKGWWPTFIKIARQNRISLIVIGSNPYESASFKDASFGTAYSYFRINRLFKSITKGLKELAANPYYLTCSWPAVIKGGLMASHLSPAVKFIQRDMTIVSLFDYLRWNENDVISTITNNLGWKKDPQHDSPWRFDCRLDHIKKFLYKQTIGVSELEDLFSKMVREGMITREEALKRLETEDITPVVMVENVLNQINCTMKELNWPQEWIAEGLS